MAVTRRLSLASDSKQATPMLPNVPGARARPNCGCGWLLWHQMLPGPVMLFKEKEIVVRKWFVSVARETL